MLEALFSEHFEDLKGDIISYISNYGHKNIKSIFCWSMVEYQQGLFIYSCDKDQFSNDIAVFIELWTAHLVDIEEWHSYFQNSIEFGKSVFENYFLDDYKRYSFSNVDAEEAKGYVYWKIERMLENMASTRKRYPQYDQKWTNEKIGIFINGSMTKEEDFKYEIVEPIIKVYELMYNRNYAGDRELFIETEDKYIYFAG